MNKKELIKAIAAKTGLSQKDVRAVIDAFIEVVIETLKKGEEVKITGFGTFTRSLRKARTYKNPQGGRPIEVPDRYVPVFRVGSKLKAEATKEVKRRRSRKKKK